MESYERLTVLRTWNEYVIDSAVNSDAKFFFVEALNDLLSSHALAQCGSWRVALKSHRSAIENTLYLLYYKDHKIEYQLWLINKHKLGVSELLAYLKVHPKFSSLDQNENGISATKKEYGTLSKAVHGAFLFRMTDAESGTNIWQSDNVKLSKWSAREKSVCSAINSLLLSTYNESLQGTSNRQLRELLGNFIYKTQIQKDKVKNKFNIVIP